MAWKHSARGRALGIMALEPRIMFDAAGAATYADLSADVPDAPPGEPIAPATTEVVFIDASVENYETLARSAAESGAEVVILDPREAALPAIARFLADRRDVAAVHIVSHGSEGALHFGSGIVSGSNLREFADALQTIGRSLTAEGDILLYGCYVGTDAAGQSFIDGLAALTGADVAASSDLTGGTGTGGDWVLEATSRGGQVTATFDADLSWGGWSHTLASIPANVTVNFEGVGFVEGADLGSQTYTQGDFSLTYSGANIFEDTDNGEANSAGIFLGAFSGPETLTIQTTSGNEFDFASFFVLQYAYDGAQNFSIQGFRNGVSVATENYSVNGNTFTGAANTINLSNAFNNVDRVVINSTGSGFFSVFDSFVFQTVPNVAPVVTSPTADALFTENAGPVTVDAALTVVDNEADNITGATVSITTGFQNGADVLAVTDAFGITSSYNAGTGVLTLSGTATAAQYQTVLRSLTFNNTSDNPSTTARVLTYSVTDAGSGSPGTVTQGVNVTAVNDAPVLAPANTVSFYTEGGTATTILSGLTITDPDTTSFQTATVTITDGRVGDVLAATNTGGFTASYNAGTYTLTITGPGTLADLQTMLRSVTYASTSDDPTAADTDNTRGLSITVTEAGGGLTSNQIGAQVGITSVNDNPTLTGLPASVVAAEDTPSAIDLSAVTFADPDSGNGNVTLTIAASAGTLAASSGGGVTIGGSGTGTLTLTGTAASIDAYLNNTTAITYTPAANVNGTAAATLTFSANDGGNTGTGGGTPVALGTVNVDINAVNDDPTATGVPATASFTEDTAGELDLSGITLSDVDAGASSITLRLVASGGTMAAVSGGGVTIGGSGTGTLTLTGTVAAINTYLVTTSNIQYTPASNVNGANVATITVIANDNGNTGAGGGGDVNLGTVNVSVTAVNDDPTMTGIPASVNFTENTAAGLDLSPVTFADVDSGSGTVTLIISASGGTLAATSGGGVTIGNSGTGTITLSGTAASIDAYLNNTAAITYTPATGATGSPAATITLTANDAGNTGTGGGTNVALGTVNVNVTAVNDAPVLTGVDGTPTFTEGGPAVLLDPAVSVTDAELSPLNTGNGDFTGSVLTIARNGGASAEDVFSFLTGGNLVVAGGTISAGGNFIATFTSVGGTLTLSFFNTGTVPSTALVNEVLSSIRYANTSDDPPGTVQLNWSFSDGNTGTQGTGGALSGTATQTVTINAVNDPPTLTATGTNPSYTEGGGASDLFSGVTASTIEAADRFTGMTLTVTNVSDGAGEILRIDGTDVALTNGNSVLTGTLGLTVNVSVTGSTATVSFTGTTLTNAQMQTLVDTLAYRNGSENPTVAGNRVVTITQIADNGGGTNTAAPNLVSTVSLTAVNDPPVVGNVNGETSAVVAGGGLQNVALFDDATVTNVDSADYNGGFLTIVQNTGTTNGSWGLDGIGATSGGDGTIAAGETIFVGGIAIGTVHATDDGQGGNTLRIDFDNANATNARVEVLLRALTYSGPSVLGDRGFTLTLNDADGTAGGGDEDTTASFTVSVTPNPPVVANLDGDTVTYTEQGGPVAIDAGTAVVVSDADSTNFDGGNLTIAFTAGLFGAEDRLVIDTTGTVTLSAGMTAGSVVSVGGNAIGTIRAGATGTGENLIIDLSGASATPAAISAVLQSLRYDNVAGDVPTAGNRVLSVTVTDSGGGSPATSTAAVVTITVQAVDDAPTLTGAPTNPSITDTATATPFTGLTFGDVEGSGGTITITYDASAGTLSGTGLTGIAGSYTLTGATPAELTTRLQALVFTPAANATAPGTVTPTAFTLTPNDGTVNGTAFTAAQVTVTSVNDAPTLDGTALPTLVGIAEDVGAPTNGSATGATQVSTLLGGAADVDFGTTLGIAVTAASGQGTLWYSTDGGATWTQATGLAASTALLLRGTDLIYFQSAANLNGTVADALTFRAWDATTGTAGGTADTTTNGGTTAFSSTIDTVAVTIAAVNDAPTLTGVAANPAILDTATATPFTGLTFGDVEGSGGTITITYDASRGTLAGTGLTGTAGSYTLAGATPAELTARLQALVFTPAANIAAPGTVTVTSFTLTPNDGTENGTAFTTAQVTVTSVNDAPTVDGFTPGLTTPDIGTATPFASVTVTDPDTGQPITVTVTLDDAAKGVFTAASLTASGFVHAGGGVYTLTAANATVAQAALRALVFDPAENRAAPGASETTTFTVSVSDGVAPALVDATTTVTATSVNDAPTVVGTVDPVVVTIGDSVTITLPPNLFVDGDVGPAPTVTVERLPPGLVFDPVSRTITGTVSAPLPPGTTFDIVSTDASGARAVITVPIAAGADDPVIPQDETEVPVAVVPENKVRFIVPPPTPTNVLPVPPLPPEDFGGIPPIMPDPTLPRPGFYIAPFENGTAGFAIRVQNAPDGLSLRPGASTEYTLPAATFVVRDPTAAVLVGVTLEDGAPLPPWVTFDAATGTFRIEAPPGFDGTLSITVTATLPTGETASTTLEIEVDADQNADAGDGATTVAALPADIAALLAGIVADTDAGVQPGVEGKPAFSDAVKAASRGAWATPGQILVDNLIAALPREQPSGDMVSDSRNGRHAA